MFIATIQPNLYLPGQIEVTTTRVGITTQERGRWFDNTLRTTRTTTENFSRQGRYTTASTATTYK